MHVGIFGTGLTDSSEKFLKKILDENNISSSKIGTSELVKKLDKPVLVEMWKERFFYFVLKWEFNYIDNLGKASALSTDQIDVENGKRYGIEFVDENNSTINPIILHNSPSGAIERVIYALLEKCATDAKEGRKPMFPLWLAPTQVRIIPLTDDFLEFSPFQLKFQKRLQLLQFYQI